MLLGMMSLLLVRRARDGAILLSGSPVWLAKNALGVLGRVEDAQSETLKLLAALFLRRSLPLLRTAQRSGLLPRFHLLAARQVVLIKSSCLVLWSRVRTLLCLNRSSRFPA